jgi:hypothetical protein
MTEPPPVSPPSAQAASLRTRSPWRVVAAVGGSILLVCLVAAGALYSGTVQRGLLAIEPNCTVGITGTAATMTIEGWAANQDCSTIVGGRSSFLGTFDPSQVYLYTTTPTNPVVCELDRQGRHLIVRDEGVFKIVGNALCQALRSPTATSQTAVQLLPTATATAAVATMPPAPPAVATPPGIWCRNDGYLATNPACEIYPSPYQPQAGERTVAKACDTAGCSVTASATMYGPWAIVAGCYPGTTPNNRIVVYVSLIYAGLTYDSWGYVPCTGGQNGHFAYSEYRRSASGSISVLVTDDNGNGGLGSGFEIDLVQR